MASCNTQCGCNSCTRVGALNSICRANSHPFYTGPCPPAPCTNLCGSCNPGSGGCNCGTCSPGSGGCNCGTCGCNPCCGSGCGDNCGCADPCGCDGRDSGACGDSCGCANAYSSVGCRSCRAETCCTDSCGASVTCRDQHCSRGVHPCMYDTDCEQYSCERDACPCGHHRGHGVFFAHGAISLSAGGAVPLTARYADAQCFSCSYGNILIRRPGLYYAAVTMDVPGDCPISTVIRLELDNQAVCPPEIPVDTGCGGPAANFAGHTVFHARAGSLLKLSSLEAISLPDSGRQSFTLTLFRLN